MKKVLSILLLTISLTGCDKLNSQQKQIDDLNKKVESLQKNVDLAFSNSLDYKIEKFRQSALFFTPANVGGGFQILRDQQYSFIISLDKLKKFPGGYEAYFDIGNPYGALFKNVPFYIAWGKNWASNESNEKNTITIPEIKPVSWNKFKIVLSPANEDSIQNMVLTMGMAGQIFLYKVNNFNNTSA